MWTSLVKRISSNGSTWKPKDSSRLCSKHFVDGIPTLENPNPSLCMGYQLPVKTPRRELNRDSFPVQVTVADDFNYLNYSSPINSPSCVPSTLSPAPAAAAADYSYSADHDYSFTTSHEKCETCISKENLVKSLVSKVNTLTQKLKRISIADDVRSKSSFSCLEKKLKLTQKLIFTLVCPPRQFFKPL